MMIFNASTPSRHAVTHLLLLLLVRFFLGLGWGWRRLRRRWRGLWRELPGESGDPGDDRLFVGVEELLGRDDDLEADLLVEVVDGVLADGEVVEPDAGDLDPLSDLGPSHRPG